MRLLVWVPLQSLPVAAAKSITLPLTADCNMMVHCLSCLIDDHFPLNSLIMLIGESTKIEPTKSKTRKHLTLRILLWSVNTTQQKHTHLISFWDVYRLNDRNMIQHSYRWTITYKTDTKQPKFSGHVRIIHIKHPSVRLLVRSLSPWPTISAFKDNHEFYHYNPLHK